MTRSTCGWVTMPRWLAETSTLSERSVLFSMQPRQETMPSVLL